ncbi:hypothetical protein J6590_070934 [Homalodisca vitripennis]|nr:hypothetical protein J6590_070934 [Homalodisca vitripennis]
MRSVFLVAGRKEMWCGLHESRRPPCLPRAEAERLISFRNRDALFIGLVLTGTGLPEPAAVAAISYHLQVASHHTSTIQWTDALYTIIDRSQMKHRTSATVQPTEENYI